VFCLALLPRRQDQACRALRQGLEDEPSHRDDVDFEPKPTSRTDENGSRRPDWAGQKFLRAMGVPAAWDTRLQLDEAEKGRDGK
jgi:hypothetical protein